MDLCGRQQRTFLEKIGPMLTGDGGWGAWLPEGSRMALGGLRVLRAGMGYKCMKLSLLNSVFLTHNICGPLRKAAEDIA